jgi:hypothetical protein
MHHRYEISTYHPIFQSTIRKFLISIILGVVSSVDVVMTPCGDYTYFCCGQDDAARSCCTSGNGTVLLAAGTAILPTATVTYNNTIAATTSPTGCPSDNSTATSNTNQPTKNTVPVGAAAGLGGVLGVALIILAVLIAMWRKKVHRATEAEQRAMVAEQRTTAAEQRTTVAEQRVMDVQQRIGEAEQLVMERDRRIRELEPLGRKARLTGQ